MAAYELVFFGIAVSGFEGCKRELSGEGFAVLRKVPTGPNNMTSDPPPPPASQVVKGAVVVDLLVLRKVPTGPNNMMSDRRRRLKWPRAPSSTSRC